MPRPEISPDPTVIAIFAGCAVLDSAKNRFQEKRYEKRAAEVRAIVTDRLHLDADQLKKKYGPDVHPIV